MELVAMLTEPELSEKMVSRPGKKPSHASLSETISFAALFTAKSLGTTPAFSVTVRTSPTVMDVDGDTTTFACDHALE